jgi:hypothetical protein
MELILHENPKYGFFVGWRDYNPVWQPQLGKAIRAYSNYTITHPHTSLQRELRTLLTRKYLQKKVSIIYIDD